MARRDGDYLCNFVALKIWITFSPTPKVSGKSSLDFEEKNKVPIFFRDAFVCRFRNLASRGGKRCARQAGQPSHHNKISPCAPIVCGWPGQAAKPPRSGGNAGPA